MRGNSHRGRKTLPMAVLCLREMKNIDWKILLSIAAVIYAVSFGFRTYINYKVGLDNERYRQFEFCLEALKIYEMGQKESEFYGLFSEGPKRIDDCLKYLQKQE